MAHGTVFLGEAEGRMEEVLADFRKGALKPVYNHLDQQPDIDSVTQYELWKAIW